MKKIDTIVEIQKTLFEIEKLLHKVSFFWDQSQDGFPPKKGPLIGWPVYQLEACLLTVNHLNSCSDSDLRKNWLALMPPIMILGHNCDVIFRMDVWVLVVRFHLMSNVFLVIGVISSNEFLSSSQRYVLKNQKRSTYIFNFSGEEQFFIFGSRNHSKRILQDVWPKLKEELLAATFHVATHIVGLIMIKNSAIKK